MSRAYPMAALAALACFLASDVALGQIVLEPAADAFVTRDLDARLNDNYGCNPILGLASTRGGGDVPYGTPDGARPLIRFDLTGQAPVNQATLVLTCGGYNFGDSRPYTMSVHRLLGPWEEGNGNEHVPHPPGSGCEFVDPADGVAWIGAGDGGDANNQTQPDYDPTPVLTQDVPALNVGDLVLFDVTDLVNDWILGTYPNHGFLLRNETAFTGEFIGIAFGTRENDTYDFPGLTAFTEVDGPRLWLDGAVSLEKSTWGRIKARYR